MTSRVLVVDDDRAVRFTLRAILEEHDDIDVVEAPDGVAGLAVVRDAGADLVISDLRMPGLDGMGLLAQIGALPGAPPVIVITAHGDERTAVEAMKAGALDYFAKPFDPDEISRVVLRTLGQQRLAAENLRLRGELALSRGMVFTSEAMRRVAERVARVAPRDVTVLLTGESGTGKELVARALVESSPRAGRPFVKFNAAALPRELAEAELFGHLRGAFTGADRPRRGLFREADGGTLLLDEIGELDLSVQAALLRVLQEREIRPVGSDKSEKVDVRVIAATHKDLVAMVRTGEFREDLFYRLNVVPLHLPALRERPEDVLPLARHFAERAARRYGLGEVRLTPALEATLTARPWPGNVRELENVVERLVVFATGPVLDVDPLVFDDGGGATEAPPLKEQVARFEKGLITEALARSGGNQSEAARQLGVNRATLLDKLARYGLR
ncbi:MAG: sigma-54-dependent Fis family transcriptional regulator [Deltaproteobacteria bacterium HGW-Deltaproteobacteria-14]|jgi:DNA-binding NtrC family response regulator|nr:MAG: sigma-54-dependent Fis family transcriptional regulator [Deltaproteobacteria bacterium HGW-Deltaproteobacteria-14]